MRRQATKLKEKKFCFEVLRLSVVVISKEIPQQACFKKNGWEVTGFAIF